MSSASLREKLDFIKEKRKNGELSPSEFYRELLYIVLSMTKELIDENISEEDIKKQIPLILAFLEEQIEKMESRGH